MIETWLFDKKLSPNTFSLEFRNGGKSEKEITSIGKDGVIGAMVDALTEKVKYERIILFAKVDGKKKILENWKLSDSPYFLYINKEKNHGRK